MILIFRVSASSHLQAGLFGFFSPGSAVQEGRWSVQTFKFSGLQNVSALSEHALYPSMVLLLLWRQSGPQGTFQTAPVPAAYISKT